MKKRRSDIIDETGKRYGWMTVLRLDESQHNKHQAYWVCKCDCGKEFVARGDSIRCGAYTSCGCNIHKHRGRFTHGEYKTRLYTIWADMKHRCVSPYTANYKHYGGRGITLCDEWMEFEPFRDWALSNGYADNLTIDRIDVNGNYEPRNCRWVTRQQQSLNTRRSLFFEYNGKTQTLYEWSNEYGILYDTAYSRFKRGWSIDEILTTPIMERGRRISVLRRSKQCLNQD